MHFTHSAAHLEFFKKNQYIEFEDLISTHQITQLKKNAEDTIAKRLHISHSAINAVSAPEIYQVGYDLWRENEAIKKIAQKQAFASLASELFQTVPLRYGFDQYFMTAKCTVSPYSAPHSIEEISCLHPLAGALLLPLQDLSSAPNFFPMPIKAGNGLFLSKDFSFPWPQLFSTTGLCFFLIVFAPERTMFRADSKDPHAVSLKKLGYVFNETLNSKLHPLLIRKNS